MSIDRLKSDVITGFSTDKKKILLSGFYETMISVFEEMEQMVRHIDNLEEKIKKLEEKVDN